MVHRIVKQYLQQQLNEKQQAALVGITSMAAAASSERERIAEEAERASKKIKIAEYMTQFIGETFSGIISSVTGFGFFVELENMVEGLVHVTQLQDDYYELIPEQLQLVGVRTKRKYIVGDTVQVKLARADKETGEIDFILAERG